MSQQPIWGHTAGPDTTRSMQLLAVTLLPLYFASSQWNPLTWITSMLAVFLSLAIVSGFVISPLTGWLRRAYGLRFTGRGLTDAFANNPGTDSAI